MSFTTEKSKYDGKAITVPAQVTADYTGPELCDVRLPCVINFDGAKRTKRVKDGKGGFVDVPMGLPDVVLFLAELPEQSIRRIFEYGASKYLADGIASAEDAGEAHARLRRRVELLISGELTERRPNAVKKAEKNPDFAIISKLFAEQLLKLTEKNYGGKKPLGKDKEESAKWDSAHIDAMKLLAGLPKVKKMVEEEKARMEALKSAIADEDILGGLLDDDTSEEETEGEEGEEGDEDSAVPEGEDETDSTEGVDVTDTVEETEKEVETTAPAKGKGKGK